MTYQPGHKDPLKLVNRHLPKENMPSLWEKYALLVNLVRPATQVDQTMNPIIQAITFDILIALTVRVAGWQKCLTKTNICLIWIKANNMLLGKTW
jgi:hypothetical protein